MGEQHIPLQINEDGLVTKVGHDIGGSYEYTTNKNGELFDNCVICGKETQYKTNTHIDMRVGYVEGVGQTCNECNTAGSSKGRDMIMIPRYLVEQYPNNMLLGEAVRKFYWDNYK